MTAHCSMYIISICFLILTAVQSEYSTSYELQFPDWTCTFFAEENLICVEHNHTLIPCIRNGYWLGDTGLRVNNQTIYGLQACTLGSCSEVCETCGNLPNMEWCKVPPIEPTLYYKEHRIAPICSQCQESYSLSYDSYSCVHFTTGKQVGLFLMFILYWVFLLSQVVFILKLLTIDWALDPYMASSIISVLSATSYGMTFLLTWILCSTHLECLHEWTHSFLRIQGSASTPK